ncbi:MAG: hypothetical protein LQ343_003704 [Gyalolechia ehrenbergii]|nr:MAG: hypothetical protein LQ343_003704 [Gyalolechia ehrenbergii]
MPNRHSHAFVLSRYEARGFFSLPHYSNQSPSISEYDLSLPDPANPATPSLNAVPALSSDSSTTSTASSLGDPPPEPLHSASSSIITEIYAPKSPAQSPPTSPIAEVDEAPARHHDQEDISWFSPISEQPRHDSPPPPSTSRFSSLHDFSAFLNPLPPPKRHKRHSDKYQHNRSSVQSSQPSHTTTLNPKPAYSRPSSTQFRSHKPKHHVSYERLEPTFDDESLASLCLSAEEGEAAEPTHPLSANMDVLPWEYPFPEPSKLATYRPQGFPDIQPKIYYEEAKNMQQNRTATPSPTFSPTRYSSISQRSRLTEISYHSHQRRIPSNDLVLETAPFPLSLDDQIGPCGPQSRSRSSSFDSVAPPPIRISPRAVPTRQVSRRGREKGRFSVGMGWLGGG